MLTLAKRAKEAKALYSTVGTTRKNHLLLCIAKELENNIDTILKENDTDIQNARARGIQESMLDRLLLTRERILEIAAGVRKVADLEDPVGMIDGGRILPNGLRMEQLRVPLGVVGIIYEARPNVTVDAAALCLKAGNCCMLRGGKEAIYSNIAFAKVMRQALRQEGLPEDAVILVEDTSRESANAMMKLNGYLDVLIPRGGAGLIQTVVANATVPVIETGVGNCHIYVDYNAEIEMAVSIVNNAKTSRPSVCNAAETLLVHREIAPRFLPKLKMELDKHHVQLRGCSQTREILGEDVQIASPQDYETEFLDYILAVKVVEDIEQAITHIARYTTGHSEGIITNDFKNASRFTSQVDAAAVYVNASTRFTDGGEFGLGAEIGISTQKLHARGPMGLKALTTIKYALYGDGQIR